MGRDFVATSIVQLRSYIKDKLIECCASNWCLMFCSSCYLSSAGSGFSLLQLDPADPGEGELVKSFPDLEVLSSSLVLLVTLSECSLE